MSKNLPRRRSLTGSAAVAAGAAISQAVPARAQLSSTSSALSSARLPKEPAPYTAFMHGVASGDPIPNSVITWTRVTVSPEAVPGSGLGADADVQWEIATDREFTNIVSSGMQRATAQSVHACPTC